MHYCLTRPDPVLPCIRNRQLLANPLENDAVGRGGEAAAHERPPGSAHMATDAASADAYGAVLLARGHLRWTSDPGPLRCASVFNQQSLCQSDRMLLARLHLGLWDPKVRLRFSNRIGSEHRC